MAVSMEDVRRVLDPEEPDYERAAALCKDALPHLQALDVGADPMLASKAVYAASLIEDNAAAGVVRAGARSDNPVLRVAAAAAARNLPVQIAREILAPLNDDGDPGIRKVARASSRPDQVG